MIGNRLRPVVLAVAVVVASACSGGSNGGDADDAGTDVDSTGMRAESESADALGRDGARVDSDIGGEAESNPGDVVGDGAVESDRSQIAARPENYLVWAHYVEPMGLANVTPTEGGLFTASWIREALFESLYSVDATIEYVPELLAEDATVIANDNGTVTIEYRLRPELAWSDGQPLTAADVSFTHDVLVEGCPTEADGSIRDGLNEGCVYPLADRNGYDLVTDVDVTGALTFEVSMAAFYPDWRGLYRHILPAHSFETGASQVADVLTELKGSSDDAASLPSSAPLVVESWSGGTLRLARNDNYHGSVHPGLENAGIASVAGVQISFVSSLEAARQAVRSRAADVMVSPVNQSALELLEEGTVAAAVAPALEYDHLGMNRLNPHLADPLVRSAIVAAIGRRSAVMAGYGRLFESPGIRAGQETISPDGVGNAYWLPVQAGYEDHQPQALEPDAVEAARLLAEAGYERQNGGVFRHPERGGLSLRFSTNAGDELRVRMQRALADQLEQAGFEIVLDNGDGGSFLTEGPFAELAIAASLSDGTRGDADLWDMTLFAWAGGPWPGLQSGSFRSDSQANPYGFGDPVFDSQAAECDAVVDDDERSACYQVLDLFVTTTESSDEGLFVVPLVERPTMLIYSAAGLESVPELYDGENGGPLANVVDYALTDG